MPRVATLAGRTLQLHAAIAPASVVAPAEERVSPQSLLRVFAASLVLLAALVLGWHLRTQARREARKKLRAACRANDARGARDALIAWGKVAGAVPVIDAAQAGALDAALYGGGAWDGNTFWRAAKPRLRQRKGRRTAPPRSGLPPFFRLQPPRS
jgi:hypothetical protein